MNKHYESVVIINAALEDQQIDATVTRIEDYIKSLGAELTATEKWGRKRLAYPIQKSKSGYYLILRYIAQTDVITKLERMFRLDETIFRYLTTLLDKSALEYYANKESEESSENTEENAAVVNDDVADDKEDNSEKSDSTV